MKMRWMIFVLMLTVSLAFAQTPAGTKTNTKQSAPFSKKTAKTTKAAAPKTMAPKATTPKTITSKKVTTPSTAKAKKAVKPAITAAATPKAAKPKAVKKEKPAAAPAAPETASYAGLRTAKYGELCPKTLLLESRCDPALRDR